MKQKNSLVSVIVNCYNGEKFLNTCISSILNQTYNKFEIIFFDNNSTDSSAKIIKNFKDKRIKYYKTKKYLKLYEARNLAIKKASGKYIAFLDTDDWWDKYKLENQLDFLRKNKNFKMIFTNFYIFFEKERRFKKFYSGLPSGNITQKLLNKYSIGISTVLLERKIFKRLSFNKKYNIIGDFDLFIKLSTKFKIGSIDKPLTFYRIHKSNFSNKRVDIYYNELKNWINVNEKKLLKNKFKLGNVKILLVKLKIKSVFKSFNKYLTK